MEIGDENPLHTAARIAAGVDHPVPLDIVVRTPAEWNAALTRGSVFATEVARHGVTMYEA